MRIAYVIPAYPPLASQPFVVNEMIAVQDAGHEVVVVPLYAGDTTGVRHGTFDRLRLAEGRVLFAGSDIAGEGAGWIEGAVGSGREAARDAVALLRS